MNKHPEHALARPVADWLRENGYPAVYAETWRGPVDLVGWNEQEDRIACIELKTSLTSRVLRQAYLHQVVTVQVYVGVGTLPRPSSLAAARLLGIGVLSIRADCVTVLVEPTEQCDILQAERDDLIDCIRHSTPSDDGGLPSLLGIGPAQTVALAVREYLTSHPRSNWLAIFRDVPNHYASHRSMSQVMNRRFAIFVSTEQWKGADR